MTTKVILRCTHNVLQVNVQKDARRVVGGMVHAAIAI